MTSSCTERLDIAIIGAGLLGLATAYRLLQQRPAVRLAVFEREAGVASHQSGHNSGVIHSGLYYPPDSLKARLCREGKADLEEFCTRHRIPFKWCGKLVVAIEQAELPQLADLWERARASGVPGVEMVGPERIRQIEPHAAGIQALWSPSTGIVDFRRVAVAFATEVRARGGEIHLRRKVTRIELEMRGSVIRTAAGTISARGIIACCGLWADRLGTLSRERSETDLRIIPFRGDYYTLAPVARELVRGLIYPVPDPRFPFLGVHLTRRIDGQVWAGPNAVIAFRRDGYRRRDFSIRDLADTVAYPGFRKLAVRYWRTGLAEMWRDWSKRAFVRELQRYIPALRAEHLIFGPSGVRAQAVRRNGELVEDFELGRSHGVLHVLNAPSPAATSALAIGRMLATEAVQQFGL